LFLSWQFSEDLFHNFTTLFSTAVPRWCHTCENRDVGILCSMSDINMDLQVVCPRGQSYCMTDIVQYSKGYVDGHQMSQGGTMTYVFELDILPFNLKLDRYIGVIKLVSFCVA
jgi:hypothetical protein